MKRFPFSTCPPLLNTCLRFRAGSASNFTSSVTILTGLGMGGNKLRKLEYLLYDAQQQGATMLLTLGGAQTNHGRLTAAVAAKYGDALCDFVHRRLPRRGERHILLDRIMGADVILKKNDGRPESDQQDELIAQMVKKYAAEGEKVYVIPVGGSNRIGMLGYYECAREITAQAFEMGISHARLLCGVGSLGTYMACSAACGARVRPCA